MNEKKVWIGIAAATVLLVAGLGAAIHFQKKANQKARQDVAELKTRIEIARTTIAETAGLEREVIVLRELSEVIDQVLPTMEDLNNLIDDFYQYATDSQVIATAFKRKPDRGQRGAQGASFDKVSYTLTLEGGIFEFLEFLNKIETHGRFMAVSTFKITSTTRQQLEKKGQAQHKINVDVDTYTYNRKGSVKAMRIEGYDRKRDLLAGEINRRRKALTLSTFHYRGDRSRRDPWIDPRVPSHTDGSGPTVQQQTAKVDELVALMEDGTTQWEQVKQAKNIIDRMVKKDELDKTLALLGEEIRRIEADGYITYVPVQRRLENEVYDPLEILRAEIQEESQFRGPRPSEMRQLIGSMKNHIDLGEYDLALEAYRLMREALTQVPKNDPERSPLILDIEALALEARTLRDFSKIELDFGGSVIIEGKPPVIMINGRSWGIGDLVAPELEIAEIRSDEVDFYFRGFILTRVY